MSKAGFDVEKYQPLYTPLAIFLGGLAIAAAILVTGGFSGSSDVAGEADFPSDSGEPQFVEVSIDDDPVLGDPDAPVTIVEFSDFECPYCKTFHDETLAEIKKAYIDTGKVKFVYRDFPLDFHDPAATKEAIAANCAHEQGGDEAYFSYHAEIFSKTKGNGDGVEEGAYEDIAQKIGLDITSFRECLLSERFRGEVEADLSYVLDLAEKNPSVFAQGIGTPTFFIGKSDSSGTFVGRVVPGALPFGSFQEIIEDLLK